jgi:hypothetical protein
MSLDRAQCEWIFFDAMQPDFARVEMATTPACHH